jgi:hypothetical protein
VDAITALVDLIRTALVNDRTALVGFTGLHYRTDQNCTDISDQECTSKSNRTALVDKELH